MHKAGSRVCLVMVLSLLSNWGTLDLVKQGKANTIKRDTNANAFKSDDTVYYLDISNPSLSQPIEFTNDGVECAKFVQVEVSEVLNPKKYALTFEVRYQPKSNMEVYLGSFSLYPADNPGKFIVSTQGKVKNDGAIVLSMVITDKVDTRDLVKVGIKKIKFLKG